MIGNLEDLEGIAMYLFVNRCLRIARIVDEWINCESFCYGGNCEIPHSAIYPFSWPDKMMLSYLMKIFKRNLAGLSNFKAWRMLSVVQLQTMRVLSLEQETISSGCCSTLLIAVTELVCALIFLLCSISNFFDWEFSTTS